MATNTYYGNLVNYLCMPTENDHYGDGYGGVGAGRIPTELTLLPLLKGLGGCNGFVTSGFAPPSSGTLISGVIAATVTAGSAVINGCRIVGTSSVSINLEISATNWIYLKLELDGSGKVYRPLIHVQSGSTMPATPANAVPLGKCVCNASSITGTTDMRYQNRMVWGYIDDSADGMTLAHVGSGDWTADTSGGNAVITFNTSFLQAPVVVMVQNTAIAFPTVTTSTITIARGSYKWIFVALG